MSCPLTVEVGFPLKGLSGGRGTGGTCDQGQEKGRGLTALRRSGWALQETG
ncbi:hypothetical protein GCM10010156_48250 [Planobispora rosea]|uniref:Uncharacterized protein n=1 Tax=Planobispora rosea TaxID=35762 RepID=A0A8J3WDU0_PLARO|nr:hypothetical protein GCM10010156_48250 [Planobispora rosea]GIH86284.1 hypothetical protein Pro02_46920 [Planobispora rosea]